MKIDFRERENLILRAGVIIFGMLYTEKKKKKVENYSIYFLNAPTSEWKRSSGYMHK
jgi:hypothetical protein